MVRSKVSDRWNSSWGDFTLTKERYKFPLGLVLIYLILGFVPIVGLISYIAMYVNCEGKRDCEWEDSKPSFTLIELLKKEI